jgi:hypothetical protein
MCVSKNRPWLCSCFVALALAAEMPAQSPRRLAPGIHVRIRAPGVLAGTPELTVRDVDADSVTFDAFTAGATATPTPLLRRVARADITQLEFYEVVGTRWAQGMRIGAVTGGVPLLVYSLDNQDGFAPPAPLFGILGATVGGLIGGTIGGFMKRSDWVRVAPDRRTGRFSINPLIGRSRSAVIVARRF